MIEIDLVSLSIAFIPVAMVIAILYAWRGESGTALYAVARMLLQLLLVGYVLTFIFDSDSSVVVALVLAVMLCAAAWISLRPLAEERAGLLPSAFLSIAVGGLLVLILVTQVVLKVDPWYEPRYLLPLGGMIFAGSMNAVSLAAERFYAERSAGVSADKALRAAYQASLIPTVNSLFAVGLVSLPGMMTGQILSGTSPLVAARYQIVVMCMLFGASGLSAALFLLQNKNRAPVKEKSDE